eukprot:60902_1
MTAFVEDDVMAAYKNIQKRRKNNIRFVMFKIVNDKIVMDQTGMASDHYQEFLEALPLTHPRYCLYDYEFKTNDGRMADKLYFIHWAPVNCNTDDQIRYTQALPSFRERLLGTDHLSFTNKADVKTKLKSESNPDNPDAAKSDDDDDSEASEMSD